MSAKSISSPVNHTSSKFRGAKFPAIANADSCMSRIFFDSSASLGFRSASDVHFRNMKCIEVIRYGIQDAHRQLRACP